MKHHVKLTAIIVDSEGKRVFHSFHTTEFPVADPKDNFAALVPTMEAVLTDAHKQFCPTPEEAGQEGGNGS